MMHARALHRCRPSPIGDDNAAREFHSVRPGSPRARSPLPPQYRRPALRIAPLAYDPEKIICRPVFSMIMPPPWHCGRAVLIAAHTTTPQLASGATIAIEDAVMLARYLASGSPLDTALEAFTGARYDRCRMVVENSEQLGEWEKHPGTGEHPVAKLVAESYPEWAKEV
jgi:2-polyprenyl-6-methoxyphenol hydroxylase-like FAD-dependent oxidoreductase